ncbi:hypothetical protein RirG_169170 [Rhizophagus irregularis DAOM 197198w]|uniref:HAT C-terminal dimerisation domain-containing protein n=2 Tax=Rhizophagus irregularis TaxID=588596 RepID=A0A015M4C0_RHIIW|nr:hypothetical protein RirG_169170 [Rhizophagus irregularis DAOM 197198w]
MVLLSPIERATRLLSASSYPTHGDVRFVFLGIQEHLSRYINDESFSQHIVADAIYQKLSNYWPIMSESSQISSLLDPRVKFSAFEDEIEKTNAKNLILNLAGYAFSLSPLPAETTPGNNIIETQSFFRNLRNNTVTLNSLENTNSSASRTLDNEMERYLAIPLEDQVDPLLWWQVRQEEFPILSRIAQDYLCIQATSVASEQAFSVAGLTISPLRNRLDAETARVTLCLKSWIREAIC